MSTPIPRIRQIRDRLEKATKGPWRVEPELDSKPEGLQNVMTDAGSVEPIISCLSNIPDAAFIAHSREDVEYLLAKVEAAELLHKPLIAILDAVNKAIGDERRKVSDDEWESHAEVITRLRAKLEQAEKLAAAVIGDQKSTGPFRPSANTLAALTKYHQARGEKP